MRSDRFLWMLLIGLLAGAIILAVHHEQGVVAGIDLNQFGSLVYMVPVLIVVGAAAWSMVRGRLGEALVAALFWLLLAAVLAIGYTYRGPLLQVAERVIGQVLPGYVISLPGSSQTVEVVRGADGDFAVRVGINDATVPMLLDTGASSVVLTLEVARQAGLPVEFLKYDVPVDTANGRTRAAAVVIDKMTVGGIVERRIPALVAPAGMLRTPLLGMSFLSRLDSFEVRGDRLLMRGPGRDAQ
ncbi:aspartic protease [Azorhizobium oxalatiphilum]|uniref:Aspartic protease n=1 Tax=Azorhizobium oxalatiphilum TaxID=980631 RepID=A0A917BTM9_9HYPH|nr:TIGR02281 family clan AA aspartic protease [Azorhizobium oxalatiphilum]GGF56999.1 aspartic protease [Azorhizobium oxalatiphilum]